MKGKIAFAFLSVGVLAFACGPRPHGGDSASAGRSAKSRSAHEAKKENGAPAAPLAASLDVNIAEGVRFEFRVTNTGEKKLEVNFPSGQTHELVVLDTLGREVWRWSAGRMFTQALQNKVLRTSDALAYAGRWRDAPRGRYVAVATLASANYPMEQRTEFIVR